MGLKQVTGGKDRAIYTAFTGTDGVVESWDTNAIMTLVKARAVS